MSVHLTRRPIYEIRCDAPGGCNTAIEDDWEYGLRARARDAGWQLRPLKGKGTRTAPDLCPEHKPSPPIGGAS